MASASTYKHLDPVVRKPVIANLGLEFNRGSCFSQMFFLFKRVRTANNKPPTIQKQPKSKCRAKSDLQESLSLGFKTELKMDANLGLA